MMTCRVASSGVVDHWRFERNASRVRAEEAAVTPKRRWMSSELHGVSRKSDDPVSSAMRSPCHVFVARLPSGTEPQFVDR